MDARYDSEDGDHDAVSETNALVLISNLADDAEAISLGEIVKVIYLVFYASRRKWER